MEYLRVFHPMYHLPPRRNQVSEIQRYTMLSGKLTPDELGSLAFYSEYAAALAKQAEESRRHHDSMVGQCSVEITRLHAECTKHEVELAGKVARHAKTFRRLVKERSDADQRADRFAKELAEAKLAERDAEVRRLRGAAEELIEVAELRGDNVLEHPANDPLLWTARMQTAWVELEEALTPILEEKPNGD